MPTSKIITTASENSTFMLTAGAVDREFVRSTQGLRKFVCFTIQPSDYWDFREGNASCLVPAVTANARSSQDTLQL